MLFVCMLQKFYVLILKSESRKVKTLCAIGVLIRSRRRIDVCVFSWLEKSYFLFGRASDILAQSCLKTAVGCLICIQRKIKGELL